MNRNNLIFVLLAATASAVMTASAALSPNAAVMLALLSPLPVYVVGFMAGPIGALMAGVGASVFLGFGFSPNAGLQFFMFSALAPVLLSHLSLRNRPQSEGEPLEGEMRADGREWYPEGRLILWGAGLCFILMAGRFYLFDGLDMQATMKRLLFSIFEAELQNADEISRQGFQEFADTLARLTPALGVHFMVLSLFVNFRLAAVIAKASGRGLRPWAPIANMVLPREAGFVLAGLIVASLLPGELGNFAILGLASLGAAFALGGLGVMHRFIDQLSAGPLLYFVLYLSLSLFYPLVATLLAALSLADPYLNSRKHLNIPKE